MSIDAGAAQLALLQSILNNPKVGHVAALAAKESAGAMSYMDLMQRLDLAAYGVDLTLKGVDLTLDGGQKPKKIIEIVKDERKKSKIGLSILEAIVDKYLTVKKDTISFNVSADFLKDWRTKLQTTLAVYTDKAEEVVQAIDTAVDKVIEDYKSKIPSRFPLK